MAGRIQIPRGPDPVALRPGASPVDTFRQPNAGSKLGQLAEALSSVAPSIARFSDVVAEHQSERQKQEGILAAQKAQEEGKTYREAIQQGVISEHQSPWFRVGAQETFGRVNARKYVAEFMTSDQYRAVQDSTDPKDFDKAESDFRKQWEESNVGAQEADRHYQLAFYNQAEQAVDSLRQEFAQGAGNRLVKATGEAFHAEVFQTVTNAQALHLPAEFTAKLIKVSFDRQVAAGFKDKGALNQLTANAIAEAAKRANDVTLLDVMDHISLGKGKLSGTSYGSQLRERAEQEIGAEVQRKYTQAAQRERAEKEHQTDSILSQVGEALNSASDPHEIDLKPLRDAMLKVDPEKAQLIFQMQDAWLNHVYTDDPDTKRRLFVGIHAGGPGEVTVQTVARAFAAKQITAATFREMMTDLQTRENEGNKASKFFNDDGLKFGQSLVKSMFVSEFGFEGAEMRQRAAQAVLEFTDKYVRWRKGAGANATPTDVNNFIHETSNSLLLGPNAKASAEAAGDFRKIPQATTGGEAGPQVPDWKKYVVTDASYILQLEQQYNEFSAGKRNGLDTNLIAILMFAGIRPDDVKSIEEFIKSQKQLSGAWWKAKPDSSK